MSNSTKPDTKANQAAVLLAYKEHYANVTKSCKQVGVSREIFYEWKKKKSFRKKLDKINSLLVDELESLAISRSFEGSDTMLKFLLTKLCPEKYGDKLQLGSDDNIFEKLIMEIYADREDRESKEGDSPSSAHTMH